MEAVTADTLVFCLITNRMLFFRLSISFCVLTPLKEHVVMSGIHQCEDANVRSINVLVLRSPQRVFTDLINRYRVYPKETIYKICQGIWGKQKQ